MLRGVNTNVEEKKMCWGKELGPPLAAGEAPVAWKHPGRVPEGRQRPYPPGPQGANLRTYTFEFKILEGGCLTGFVLFYIRTLLLRLPSTKVWPHAKIASLTAQRYFNPSSFLAH